MLYLGSDLNNFKPEGDVMRGETGADQFFNVLAVMTMRYHLQLHHWNSHCKPNTGDHHANNYENDVTAQPLMECPTQSSIIRPEFLFTAAIKPTPDTPILLTFYKKAGIVYIPQVNHCGPFHKCGFPEGDRVVAVNTMNHIEAPLHIIRDMVEGSDSTISFCTRNKLVIHTLHSPVFKNQAERASSAFAFG